MVGKMDDEFLSPDKEKHNKKAIVPKEKGQPTLEDIAKSMEPGGKDIILSVVRDYASAIRNYAHDFYENNIPSKQNLQGFAKLFGLITLAAFAFTKANKLIEEECSRTVSYEEHRGGTVGLLSGGFCLFAAGMYAALNPALLLVPVATNATYEIYCGYRGFREKLQTAKRKLTDERLQEIGLLESTALLPSEGNCPVCGGMPTNKTTCPSCQTPHCNDCWGYANGCAMYGCRK